MKKPTFTVFTPTYNRAHTLPRLYKSIQQLTNRDFEWVIVDDGSTDDTAALVRQWQEDNNDFPIRYFWQTNQHKKVAFNYGVREAQGKWFVPIDSDDELLPEALDHFQQAWLSISNTDYERFACVAGLCIDVHGQVVGDCFPQDPLDASSVELFFDYKIAGEKFGCLRTDVLREFPFPEDIPDLVPENVVWFRISQKYILRCFNKPVRRYNRDVESITLPKDFLKARIARAQGGLLSYAEALEWVTWKRCFRSPVQVLFLSAQYNRWSFYVTPDLRRKYRVKTGLPKFLTIICRPFGWLFYTADRFNLTELLKRFSKRSD